MNLVVNVGAGAALLVLAGCSSAGKPIPKSGVEVDVVNANANAVTIQGSPLGPSVKIEGCPAKKCSPSPGSPSGSYVGWTETQKMPRTYLISLHGSPLGCPAASGPPAGLAQPYAVVYQITVAGRCVVAQHSPLH